MVNTASFNIVTASLILYSAYIDIVTTSLIFFTVLLIVYAASLALYTASLILNTQHNSRNRIYYMVFIECLR